MTTAIIRTIGFISAMAIIVFCYMTNRIPLDFGIYLTVISILSIFHGVECNWFNHKTGVTLTPAKRKLVKIGWKIEMICGVSKYFIIPITIAYVIGHFIAKYW